MQKYYTPMEYSQNTMTAATDLERRFGAFEANLAARLREAASAEAAQAQGARLEYKWGAPERELHATLIAKREAVHVALLDSIDTPSAMKSLEQLIRATNTYMGEVPDGARGGTLLQSVARYYNRVMSCFGVPTALGGGGAGGAIGESASPLELAGALSGFRDTVRGLAIASAKGHGKGDGIDLRADVLQACDSLRDEVLPGLGVRLEDRPSGVAQFTLDDPKIVQAEVARRAEAAAEAETQRKAKAEARARAAAAEAARAAVPPTEMFRPEHDELFGREPGASFGGEFDADGLPLVDASGAPLSKSARKKLMKQRDKQAMIYVAAQIEK